MGRKSKAPWKLFWCTTDDHDEDWFVIARDEQDAATFHEDAEGYDEGEAMAELICVLPPTEQTNYHAPSWPTDKTLLACGAEIVPFVPQDGANELRERVGSGSRLVRIGGRVYQEGDIVGNTLLALRAVEKS